MIIRKQLLIGHLFWSSLDLLAPPLHLGKSFLNPADLCWEVHFFVSWLDHCLKVTLGLRKFPEVHFHRRNVMNCDTKATLFLPDALQKVLFHAFFSSCRRHYSSASFLSKSESVEFCNLPPSHLSEGGRFYPMVCRWKQSFSLESALWVDSPLGKKQECHYIFYAAL